MSNDELESRLWYQFGYSAAKKIFPLWYNFVPIYKSI